MLQVVFLNKIDHDPEPAGGCPEMAFKMGTRGSDGNITWSDWHEYGHQSGCSAYDLPEFCYDIPWKLLFHGTNQESVVADGTFFLDLFALQTSVREYYEVMHADSLASISHLQHLVHMLRKSG